MRHSDHGIVKDERGQEQPADRARAQTAQKSDPGKSATREATRDPKLNDKEKTPGSGMEPDDHGIAPTGWRHDRNDRSSD
jgi:hypothetical protein